MAGAIQRDLGLVNFGKVQAEIGVCRQAIVATIGLCDCQGNAFAGLDVKRATKGCAKA